MALPPERTSWEAAKARCFSRNGHKWHRYGGRGITMCGRWRTSFEAFLEDMGTRPFATTIGRKDNDGHYSCGKCDQCLANGWPANCRWENVREQAANKPHQSEAGLHVSAEPEECARAADHSTGAGVQSQAFSWPLTMRQEQILCFCVEYFEANGRVPPLRTIGKAAGIASTNGVVDHLRSIERKGFISRHPDIWCGYQILRLPDGTEVVPRLVPKTTQTIRRAV